MTTPTLTVDEALAVVRRLPRRDRARLIAIIAQDMAEEPEQAVALEHWSSSGVTVQMQTATPAERVAVLRQWADLERPASAPLSDAAVSREQMYD